MSTPQAHPSAKKKLKVRLDTLNNTHLNPPTFTPTPTPPPTPSIVDHTFAQYKAANLSVSSQYATIGKLRSEMPIVDRDEVDDALLRSLALQLELAVFPTCKMMQVDAVAVKRMLDDSFRKAYGGAVEAEVLVKMGGLRGEGGDGAPGAGESILEEVDVVVGMPPPQKKAKMMPLGEVRKDINAYVARRKRPKYGCRVVLLRSEAVCKKWDALAGGL
ncbi:hypothetical protein BDW02DRAFT_145588 [Decorospora gaudefroyi]|uniref:Uncharacterized protein n=1 Tax=Decorospora gaudefroyi TaxID=184978 RepID=A0A6A5JZ27_9PLEO|nr:hypothetical protein BDW02DRAFT_145588 [Decorospora gaudefroyi]